MTTQNSQNLYSVGAGTTTLKLPVVADRNPATSDISGPYGVYPIGQKWVNKTANTTYTLTSFSSSAGSTTATWVNDGVGSDLQTLTGDTGTATPSSGNILIAGGAGVTTTASGSTVTIDLTGGSAAIDTVAVQTGASPIGPTGAGLITINGATVAAGTNPIRTDGTGANTMAVEVQISQALAATDATKIGLSNFNSSHFSCDANGFVSLVGGGQAVDSFALQTGTTPITPTAAGLLTINGATVTAGTNPVRTDGTGANTMAVEVQLSQALAATDATKVGLANFDSAFFNVDANAFVTLKSGSSGQVNIQTFTANGTYTPTAGMDYCIIECIGGGAAGGGAAVTINTTISCGSGGGSGEYSRGVFSAATIGVSQAVTIGSGGTGVAGLAGNNGTSSSVGALISSAGGSGGTTSSNFTAIGGLGGTGGAGGSFRTPGQCGGFFVSTQITGVNDFTLVSGEGGSSQYGAGGRSVDIILEGTSAGSAGLGYGAGGSGAANAGTSGTPAQAGGAGTSGIVIITEYI